MPDSFLSDQGFVDGQGQPYTSTQGMGGLMFVGVQGGGNLFVFDLNRETGEAVFVGEYQTGANETAGLEFDRSTGKLFIWHDSDIDSLEVTRLSSTGGVMDEMMTFAGLGSPLLGNASTNYEGIAIRPIEDCTDGGRDSFMTIDGGRIWALLQFQLFPCW